MSARIALPIGIGGLLVGVVLGALGGGLLAGPAVVAHESLIDVGSRPVSLPGRALPDRAELAASTGQRAPTSSSAAATSFAPSDSTLARAIAGVERPDVVAELGGGSITGTVVDDRGEPLGAVTITATRRQEHDGFTDPASVATGRSEDRELEEVLRRAAESWAESRARRREVTSRADGTFVLDGLDEEATYSVVARAEGYVLERTSTTSRLRSGDVVEFMARKVLRVRFAIVDPAGVALSEGVVEVRRGNSNVRYSWSPDSDAIPLQRGRVEVKGYAGLAASQDGFSGLDAADLVSESQSFRVEERVDEVVQLVVEGRTGIRGRVVPPVGQASLHQVARILPLHDPADFDEKRLASADQENWQQGDTFTFLDLAPGLYAVGSTTWDGTLLGHEIVEVADRVVDIVVVLPEPDAIALFTVTATDSTGIPVPDVNCTISVSRENGKRASGLQRVRNSAGSTTFTIPKSLLEWIEEDPGGPALDVTVASQEWGNVQLEIPRAQRDVAVTFEEPVMVEVTVDGVADSSAANRLWVSVSERKDAQSTNRYVYDSRGRKRVPLDGRVRFDGLAPGDYTVALMVGQNMWGATTVETREVEARQAVTEVALVAPVLHRLGVVAPELKKGTRLSMYARQSDGRGYRGGFSATVDERGRAEFRDLVAGEYTLQANGVQGRMTVMVPGSDVLFESVPYDALRVTIANVEGQMHTAGLRNGDLIVALDGVDPGSAQELQNTLFNTPADVQIAVTAIREGRSADYILPAADGNRRTTLGGSVRHAYREE